MIYESEKIETEGVLAVAKLMAVAARTAPKGKGVDNILTLIIDGKDKDKVAEEMRKYAKVNNAPTFERDAKNIDQAACVFFAAVKNKPIGLPGCGMCGFVDCKGCIKAGANCMFNISDLGTAVGSAAATAADNRVDNRIMLSAGRVAVGLGLFPKDVRVCYGVPLSATGKSVFFDR